MKATPWNNLWKNCFLLVTFVGAAFGQNASCSRECLRTLLDSYLSAVAKHDPSKVTATDTVKFTENGKVLKLGEGLWKTAGSASGPLYVLDPQSGAAAVQAVVKDAAGPALLLLRIKVMGRAIAEVETIVAHKGDSPFFAPEKLTQPLPLLAAMVPTAEKSTREQLRAAADSYFTAVQTEGTPAYKPTAFSDDANRYENGVQTTNVEVMGMPAATAAEQLDKGFFKNLTISKRRFPVIDVDKGLVLGIGLMGAGDGGILLGEVFKVTGGKIRHVQAVLVNHPKNGPTGWN